MSALPELTSHRYLRDAVRHPIVRDLLGTACRMETRNEGGKVVWHAWGKGPTVVLLHGGFGSWMHWVRNIAPLTERFRVLAADLPGLGESDPVPQERPTAQDVAAPLTAGLRELLGRDEPLRLACFSLGAVVGGQVAVALWERLARVVLLGPSGLGEYWRNITTDLVRRRPDMSEGERRDTIRHNLQHSMIADPAAIDDLALDLQSDLVRQKRRLLGLPISLSDALTRVLPKLAPRLTIAWGEQDCYLVPDVAGVAVLLRQQLPDLDVRIIPRAGHWVAYEADAEVNRLLLELFTSEEPVKG